MYTVIVIFTVLLSYVRPVSFIGKTVYYDFKLKVKIENLFFMVFILKISTLVLEALVKSQNRNNLKMDYLRFYTISCLNIIKYFHVFNFQLETSESG